MLTALASLAGPSVCGISVATLSIYSAFTFWYSRIRDGQRREMVKTESALNAKLVESLAMSDLIKSFAGEDYEIAKFKELAHNYEAANLRVQRSLGLLNFGQQVIFNSGLITSPPLPSLTNPN